MNWKFRVWDIERQKMYQPTKIEVTSTETSVKVRGDDGKHRTLINRKLDRTQEFLLMANVGIEDSESSEIFDEDIVTTSKGSGVVYFQHQRGAYVVRMFDRYGGEEVLLDTVKGSIKVIGNVFEDKNLMLESR